LATRDHQALYPQTPVKSSVGQNREIVVLNHVAFSSESVLDEQMLPVGRLNCIIKYLS